MIRLVKGTLSIGLIGIVYVSLGQSVVLKKATLSNAGTSFQADDGRLFISQTIGGSAPINHFQNQSIHLLQGFEYLSNKSITSVEESLVEVFPNPSNGSINLLWDDMVEEVIDLTLLNIEGRTLDNKKIKREGMLAKADFDALPDGLYVLQVKGKETGLSLKRIVIRK